jgi:amino acid transporter
MPSIRGWAGNGPDINGRVIRHDPLSMRGGARGALACRHGTSSDRNRDAAQGEVEVANQTGSTGVAYDVTSRKDVSLLHGKAIGLIGVLFLTVTGAAPISAMLFNVPIAVGLGNGIGAPAAFLVATIVLTVFSVGFAAMARKVTAVGGFYSFISHGLGRPLGMALGFASVVAYCVFEASLAGGFAYFGNSDFVAWTGLNIPWPVFALIMIAGIAVLSYLDVKVSVMILGVALICEVIILLIFDIGVLISPNSHWDLAALNPINAFKGFDEFTNAAGTKIGAGAAAIGLFFAFWSWVGFEMAPNYGEESRDPKRIVPLSLYISVIGLGVFYTITSWAALSAYPTVEDAITQGANASGEFFMAPIAANVGTWARGAMSVLILTSAFACGMAFHNTAARYLYSLAREGVLHSAVAKTHTIYKSPHVASCVQSVLAAIIIVLFIIFAGYNDPTQQAYIMVYGLMALLGTTLIMFAQAIVSIAIIIYFRTHFIEEHHWFETLVAPLAACAAQIYIIYLLFDNLKFLGSDLKFGYAIPWISAAVIVIGIVGALWLKFSKPDVYDKLGRLLYEGLGKE